MNNAPITKKNRLRRFFFVCEGYGIWISAHLHAVLAAPAGDVQIGIAAAQLVQLALGIAQSENAVDSGQVSGGHGIGTLGAAVGAAIELACSNMEENARRMTALRNRLMEGIEREIPYVKLNGHRTERLPNNVNYSIKFIEGESILLMLDMNGIAASSGSACTSGSLDPSHVLLAIGRPHEVAHGSLRLSLCESNTVEEVDYMLKAIPEVVDYLRNMSPLWREKCTGEKPFLL